MAIVMEEFERLLEHRAWRSSVTETERIAFASHVPIP